MILLEVNKIEWVCRLLLFKLSSKGGKSDRSIIELMMLQHQQSMEAESRRAKMFQKTVLTMMSMLLYCKPR